MVDEESLEEIGWKAQSVKNELCTHYSSNVKIDDMAEMRTFVAVVNSLKLQSRDVPEIFKVLVYTLKEYGTCVNKEETKFEKTCKFINCMLERLYPEIADYLISVLPRPPHLQQLFPPHALSLQTLCNTPKMPSKRNNSDVETSDAKKVKKEVKYYNYVPPPAYLRRTVLQNQTGQSAAKDKLLPVFSQETTQIVGYIHPLATQNAQPPVLTGQKILIKVEKQRALTTNTPSPVTCTPVTNTNTTIIKYESTQIEAANDATAPGVSGGDGCGKSVSIGGTCPEEAKGDRLCPDEEAGMSDKTQSFDLDKIEKKSCDMDEPISIKEEPTCDQNTNSVNLNVNNSDIKTEDKEVNQDESIDIEEPGLNEDSGHKEKLSDIDDLSKLETNNRVDDKREECSEDVQVIEKEDTVSNWSLGGKGQGGGVLHTDIVQFAQAMANLPLVSKPATKTADVNNNNKEENNCLEIKPEDVGVEKNLSEADEEGRKSDEQISKPLDPTNSCQSPRAQNIPHEMKDYYEPLRIDSGGNKKCGENSKGSLDPSLGNSISFLEKLVENIDKPVDQSHASTRDEINQPYSSLKHNQLPNLNSGPVPGFQFFSPALNQIPSTQCTSGIVGGYSTCYTQCGNDTSANSGKPYDKNIWNYRPILSKDQKEVSHWQSAVGTYQSQNLSTLSTGQYPYINTVIPLYPVVGNPQFPAANPGTEFPKVPISANQAAAAMSRDVLYESHPSARQHVEDRSFERPRYLERLTTIPEEPCQGDMWGTRTITRKRSKRAIKPKTTASLES